MPQNAFILRISHAETALNVALSHNHICIGWSGVPELLVCDLPLDDFREIVREHCYPDDENLRRVGQAVGNLWRFIRDMKEEDLVVVPSGQGFYVARVSGPATHDELQVENDTAFRRQVEWLNNGQSIPRKFAKSALISRMKSKGTSANAGGLVGDIKGCLTLAGSGDEPSFVTDLQNDLKYVTLEALRCGHMDDRRFEELIETVLRRLGAVDTRIVPRINDEGIDIFATLLIAGIFRQIVGIQVKHYQPEPPVGAEVVCQLTQGIEKSSEKVTLGIVITSGNFSDEAVSKAKEYEDINGIPIELVDGEQFAGLIVEHGIEVTR